MSWWNSQMKQTSIYDIKAVDDSYCVVYEEETGPDVVEEEIITISI